MPKITKDELLEKQIKEYDRACEGVDTYKNYKKFDYWTLDDGLKLLIAPNEISRQSKSIYPSLFDVEFLKNSGKYKAVTRAINRSLPVEGNYEEKRVEYKNSDTEKTVFNYWYYCCAYLKVNPFEFLEFVKDKELFNIPNELQFSKVLLDSGEYSYSWQDEVSGNHDRSNHLNLDDNAKLDGKERQELGRLRTEKKTMDATVKAAIEVGKFLQTKINDNKLIIKKEIQDIVNHFDRNIPGSRIDLIWKSIPEKFRKGSGRRRKAES